MQDIPSLEKLNLPLFLGISPGGDQAVEYIMKNDLSLDRALAMLSHYVKICITFSDPVEIRTVRRIVKTDPDSETGKGWTLRYKYSNTGTKHVFHGFFLYEGKELCYRVRKGSSKGYRFHYLDKIVSCEPVRRQ